LAHSFPIWLGFGTEHVFGKNGCELFDKNK
jgi:hypothetical protein